MTDEAQASKPSSWAVLIGVNFYGQAEDALRGCVSDVDKLERYLSTSGGIEHVVKFTASTPNDASSTQPVEEEAYWPTYDNVIASLQDITEKALPGDSIYIHFSGHGTQPKDGGAAHSENGDLALVLYDPQTGYRYLHSFQLASILRKMIEKSLLVTVVLDCCFSGSVVRGEHSGGLVRSIDYNPAIDAAHPMPPTEQNEPLWDANLSRGARHTAELHIGSIHYTILCACGPHELAKELCLLSNANQYAGALSHFLLQTLKSLRGGRIPMREIYNHLRLKFHLYWPHQTPVWYGERDRLFMHSGIGTSTSDFVTALKISGEDLLYLDAGFAHGLSHGDEYEVYSLIDAAPTFRAVIDNVGPLTSELVIAETLKEYSKKETRWKAKRLAVSSWKVPVRLLVDEQQAEAILMKEPPFIHFIRQEDKEICCMFSLAINGDGHYCILDGALQPVKLAPTVPRDSPSATEEIMGVIEHLAKFKYVEAIENQNPSSLFEDSFALQLTDEFGQTNDSEGLMQVKPGDTVKIIVENLGTNPLYLTIFDMGPLWQIDDVLGDDEGADFKIVPPKKCEDDHQLQHIGTQQIELEMTVPDTLLEQDIRECDDILKIFVTNSATSLSALSLPEICDSESPPTQGRGGAHLQNLSKLLRDFSGQFRGSDGSISEENWATRSFIVRIRDD